MIEIVQSILKLPSLLRHFFLKRAGHEQPDSFFSDGVSPLIGITLLSGVAGVEGAWVLAFSPGAPELGALGVLGEVWLSLVVSDVFFRDSWPTNTPLKLVLIGAA